MLYIEHGQNCLKLCERHNFRNNNFVCMQLMIQNERQKVLEQIKQNPINTVSSARNIKSQTAVLTS